MLQLGSGSVITLKRETKDAPDQKAQRSRVQASRGLEQQMGGGGRGGVKYTGGASGVKLCSLWPKLCPDLCSDSPGHLPTLTLISNLAYSLACLSTLLLWPGCELSPTGSRV